MNRRCRSKSKAATRVRLVRYSELESNLIDSFIDSIQLVSSFSVIKSLFLPHNLPTNPSTSPKRNHLIHSQRPLVFDQHFALCPLQRDLVVFPGRNSVERSSEFAGKPFQFIECPERFQKVGYERKENRGSVHSSGAGLRGRRGGFFDTVVWRGVRSKEKSRVS